MPLFSGTQGRCVRGWARSSRALKKEDQRYREKLVELAKKHSSEAFIACDDPLEAAVCSALVEILKPPEDRIVLRKDVDQ